MAPGPSALEQPSLWPIGMPIGAQFLQQSRGEQGVTILVPFALIHADQHPLGMNVTRLQADQFGDAQTGPVRGQQQRAMLGVARGVEKSSDLPAAERFG